MKYIVGIILATLVLVFFYTTMNSEEEVVVVGKENPYEISEKGTDGKEKKIFLNIKKADIRLSGETIDRWVYTDESGTVYDAGYPIIANVGDTLSIEVENHTNVETNIHWHGLSVANDQDGPGILIKPREKHTYSFTLEKSGTYWYHSHERPVRDQVDDGMYAPFIIKNEEDKGYDKDYIFDLR